MPVHPEQIPEEGRHQAGRGRSGGHRQGREQPGRSEQALEALPRQGHDQGLAIRARVQHARVMVDDGEVSRPLHRLAAVLLDGGRAGETEVHADQPVRPAPDRIGGDRGREGALGDPAEGQRADGADLDLARERPVGAPPLLDRPDPFGDDFLPELEARPGMCPGRREDPAHQAARRGAGARPPEGPSVARSRMPRNVT
ncbi:hypothetical protein ABIC30_003914 [Methylobacterium sp. 1030]